MSDRQDVFKARGWRRLRNWITRTPKPVGIIDNCATGPPYSGGRDHCCQCQAKGGKRCPCGRRVR